MLSICRVYPGTPLFDALKPTPEQVRLIDGQMINPTHKKLSGDPNFYGDFFSSEQVPLKGDGINSVRWDWMRNVILNPIRIQNSHEIMKKFFTDEQTINFYKNFFNNPDFSQKDLDKLLKIKSRAVNSSTDFSLISTP